MLIQILMIANLFARVIVTLEFIKLNTLVCVKATKGIQWISWQQEAMKGVVKLR